MISASNSSKDLKSEKSLYYISRYLTSRDSPTLSSARYPRRRTGSGHSWSRTGRWRRTPAGAPGPRRRRRSDETFRYGLFGSRGASVSFIDQLSQVPLRQGERALSARFFCDSPPCWPTTTRFSPPRNTNKGNATARARMPSVWFAERAVPGRRILARMTLEKGIGRVYLLVFMP